MRRSIVYLSIALVTFAVGAGFAQLLTALCQPAPIAENPVQEIQFVRLIQPIPFESADLAEPLDQLVLDYNPHEFSPRGDYFIFGKKPKEFREFDVLELATGTFEQKATGNAYFATKHGDTQNMDYTVSGKVTETHLSLTMTPESAADFTYTFDGDFLPGDWFDKANKNIPVVRGKLIKLKNGVKVAEAEVKLRMENLGC